MSQRAKATLLCLAVLAIGAWMLKSEVFDNLAAARVGGDVRVHAKGLFLAPIFFAFGVVSLAVLPFAKELTQRRVPPPKPTPTQYVIMAVAAIAILALGIGVRLWLVAQLATYGYKLDRF